VFLTKNANIYTEGKPFDKNIKIEKEKPEKKRSKDLEGLFR